MERNFSQHVKEILGYSREEAERLQNSNIVPEHLLLGIIRDEIGRASCMYKSHRFLSFSIIQRPQLFVRMPCPKMNCPLPIITWNKRMS